MLAACLHPALSFLFPWPESPTGLAPSAVPALSACSPGRDWHWPWAAREAWSVWASTLQGQSLLHSPNGQWAPWKIGMHTTRGKQGELWAVLPTQAKGVISWQCPGLRQLSGKWGIPWVVRHTSLWSDQYSWTMSLECLRIYGNTRLDMAPNMPSCAWCLWPLFFSARYFFSISLSRSQKDKIVHLGLFMLWLPQLCLPVCLKGLKAWIFTDPFSRAQMRKHPQASVKRTPDVDGSFSWSHHTGRADCLVSKPPSSINPLQPVVSVVIPHASLLSFDELSCQKHGTFCQSRPCWHKSSQLSRTGTAMHYRKQKGSRDGWEVTTATEELSPAQLDTQREERGLRGY